MLSIESVFYSLQQATHQMDEKATGMHSADKHVPAHIHHTLLKSEKALVQMLARRLFPFQSPSHPSNALPADLNHMRACGHT